MLLKHLFVVVAHYGNTIRKPVWRKGRVVENPFGSNQFCNFTTFFEKRQVVRAHLGLGGGKSGQYNAEKRHIQAQRIQFFLDFNSPLMHGQKVVFMDALEFDTAEPQGFHLPQVLPGQLRRRRITIFGYWIEVATDYRRVKHCESLGGKESSHKHLTHQSKSLMP